MIRREFVKRSGYTALGFGILPSHLFPDWTHSSMSAEDLNIYLRSLVEVEEPSVDKIIVGDPHTKISRIATAWMPYWRTLKEAKSRGINTLVVHEPTFYTHRDLEEKNWDYHSAPSMAKQMYSVQVEKKKTWIEENGLVVIRCHDVLDKIKGYGIPFAFGRALGLTDNEIVRSRPYYNVYEIESRPAIEVAQMIASKLKAVGQPGVAFYGDENYPVSTIGLGTGCICNPMEFMELEMDLAIAIDDSINTWTQTTFAEDTGRPLVVVNHGSTEEFGMKELSEQLNKKLANLEVSHFKQGCTYRWVV